MKKIIFILGLIFSFGYSIAQDKFEIKIIPDTLVVQKNGKVIIPFLINSEERGKLILFNGAINDKNLKLKKNLSPLTYEISIIYNSIPVKRPQNLVFRDIAYFLSHGHSTSTKVNRLKISKKSKRTEFKYLYTSTSEQINLEIDLNKKINKFKNSSMISLVIHYSLFYYKDKLVFSIYSNKSYAELGEVFPNNDIEKFKMGKAQSNKVILKLE